MTSAFSRAVVVFAAALLAAASVRAQLAVEDRQAWPKTDFSRRTVELAEIQFGGPPKDGIPAIDRPRFDSASQARDWLAPQEPVIVLRIGRAARAYPLQILMYHEIVNDSLAGVPPDAGAFHVNVAVVPTALTAKPTGAFNVGAAGADGAATVSVTSLLAAPAPHAFVATSRT